MIADQVLIGAALFGFFVGGFACGSVRRPRPATRNVGPGGLRDVDRCPPMPPIPPCKPGSNLPPPPAHIAEHRRDCPVYLEWLRRVSCEHCGERISQKKPATTERVGGPR